MVTQLCQFCFKEVCTRQCKGRKDFRSSTTAMVDRNFYMDDFLRTVGSTEEAVTLVEELRELLSRDSFNLTKWISNSREVLTVGPNHPVAARIARGYLFSKWRPKSRQRLLGAAILDLCPDAATFLSYLWEPGLSYANLAVILER